MDHRKLMATGIIGTVVAVLCCATPVLGIVLGAVGLSAALGYLDYVLIPAMLAFIGITLYALKHRKRL